jgi:hypothetical protein
LLSDSENFNKNMLYFAKAYIDKARGETPSLNTFIDYLKPIINILSRKELYINIKYVYTFKKYLYKL